MTSVTRDTRRMAPPQLWPTIVLLAVGLLIPVSLFFVYGFWRSDIFGLTRDWNLDQYHLVVVKPFYRLLVLRTLALGLGIAAICTPLAFAAAYAIRFRITKGRNLVLFLIVLSMLASYLVRIYAWKTILGPQGAINSVLMDVGLIRAPLEFLLFGKFAIVVTLVSITLPIAVLPIYASMLSIDEELLLASHDLGAGGLITFARVTVPLSWPGIASGFFFAFILSAGDYVTPQLVGGSGGLMVGRVIYDQFGLTQDWAFASALAFTLIAGVALSALMLWGASWCLRRAVPLSWFQSTPRFIRASGLQKGLRRIPWGPIYVAALLGFLYLPLIVVIVLSFNDSSFSAFPIRGVTLHWYFEALGSGEFRDALLTSLELGAIVAVTTVVLGVSAAMGLTRHQFYGRSLMSVAILAPLVLPGIIIGVSLLRAVTEVGLDTSLLTAAVGQMLVALPFVVLIVSSQLRGLDRIVEEAGRDLGCTAVGVFRRVTLPILAPTIAASAVLVFALSLDEFVVTNYTIGQDATLPIYVWGLLLRRGITPAVNAIASTLLIASVLIVCVTLILIVLRGRGLQAGFVGDGVQQNRQGR